MNDDFNHPAYISENIRKLEGDLNYWIENKSFLDMREAIARFHERFLTIHPFTNGNGRTSRILTEFICKKNHLPVPTWGVSMRADPKEHRDTYISAVLNARREGKFDSLIRFMYG